MIPKRVTLENFLSYGPKTEIEFAADEPLWVVGGPNGVGKSAVFDAMTYCLYAEHRGGGQGHERLIRHDTDGFTVAFEFEFGGTDYRITRNRPHRGHPSQSLERKDGGCWQRVKDVDGVKALNDWVLDTVGLPFKAFCASVLLRQGQVDELLDAKPTERLETLKKIIDVERYEALSGRVGEATKFCKAEVARLQRERTAIDPVPQRDLDAAVAEVARTREVRTAADESRTRAVAAVPLAEQWARLTAEAAALDGRLAAAAERERQAEGIRRDHTRYVELSAVVPALQELGPLREALATAEREYTAATDRRDTLRTDVEAGRQRAEGLRATASEQRRVASDLSNEMTTATADRDRQSGLLALADELTTVRRSAGAFPITLAADTTAARHALTKATEDERTARDAGSEVGGLLREAKKQAKAFGDVTVGVTCSQCGQEVTAEHAEKERKRLTDRVTQLEDQADAAKASVAAATTAREAAEEGVNALTARTAERDRVLERLAGLEHSLTAFGGTADPAAARAEIERLARLLTDLQTRQADSRARQQDAEAELRTLDPAVRRLVGELQHAEAEVTRLATAAARHTATRDALLARLPEVWHAPTDATGVAAELRQLTADGIEARHHALEQDAAVRRTLEEQREKLTRDMADVPENARVPADLARRNQRDTEQAFRQADADHRTAVAHHADLTGRHQRIEALSADLAAAEADARHHATLDRLLGKGGLQRELIREAEMAIVRMAGETLHSLSCGELSISLAEADGTDKAFDLLVTGADSDRPTPAKMLSGSQKFRVAVSVALAIGRFASGKARPLECVIIDEGFGSLDKDGLRAAADELTRLKDLGDLKRIILVSHQEEFTDHFPVVIRLSKGEHGTTAEAVRRPR